MGRTTEIADRGDEFDRHAFGLIPPGEFRMGGRRYADQGPEHDVAITRPMYVGTYEVTKGEFTKFVASTNYKTRAETTGGAWWIEDSPKTRKWYSSRKHTFQDPGFNQDFSHPAVEIRGTTQAFCAWLSQKEGRHYRLPTEAEWEYFCRAGTLADAYSGDDEASLTTIGNIADATAKKKFPAWTAVQTSDGFLYTSPVGKFRPNNFGLFDTIGNAKEWCVDWYSADYYANAPKNDPPGAASGTKHVVRGGSFTEIPSAARPGIPRPTTAHSIAVFASSAKSRRTPRSRLFLRRPRVRLRHESAAATHGKGKTPNSSTVMVDRGVKRSPKGERSTTSWKRRERPNSSS